jgi:DNA replication and repair protein RecF
MEARGRGTALVPGRESGEQVSLLIESLRPLGFRNLVAEEVPLGPAITVAHGPNGAGKTNLLEALYFGLVGRSCRTANDRELIAFGQSLARVEVEARAGSERRRFLASIATGEGRRHLLEGRPLNGDLARRPAVAVFMPDRLGLVKGPPGGRRAHLDRLVAALWPARAANRLRFGRALAQRNALLARIRRGQASSDSLDAWDLELAGEAIGVLQARAAAVERLAGPFSRAAAELGLPGTARIRYIPRSEARTPDAFAAELRKRRATDIERCRTTHGPHLDEVELSLRDRSLRRYGSQGEQRTALLCLLFAERDLLLTERGTTPLVLLDDVMSELDPERRELLAERLAVGGQVLITATHLGQLPDCEREELELDAGRARGSRGRSG